MSVKHKLLIVALFILFLFFIFGCDWMRYTVVCCKVDEHGNQTDKCYKTYSTEGTCKAGYVLVRLVDTLDGTPRP